MANPIPEPRGQIFLPLAVQVTPLVVALLPAIGLTTRLVAFRASMPNGPDFTAAWSVSLSQLTTSGFMMTIPGLVVGALAYLLSRSSSRSHSMFQKVGLRHNFTKSTLFVVTALILTLVFIIFASDFITTIAGFVIGLPSGIWLRAKQNAQLNLYNLAPLMLIVTALTVVVFGISGTVYGIQRANYRFIQSTAADGYYIELANADSRLYLMSCSYPHSVIRINDSQVILTTYDLNHPRPTANPSLWSWAVHKQKLHTGLLENC